MNAGRRVGVRGDDEFIARHDVFAVPEKQLVMTGLATNDSGTSGL